MEKSDFTAISGLLSIPRLILIVTHANPDGDAIGSSLALSFYLKKKGHSVKTLVPDKYPEFLAWMPGCDDILIYNNQKEECDRLIDEAEITFATDFNQLSRLNGAGELVKQSSSKKILFDHHLNPSDEFDLKISITQITSTSEIVYNFIEAMGDLHLLDKKIAECLYTGIITDTGSLSYACNYVKTYFTLAELFKLGIDGEHIHRLIYDTYSETRIRLLGYSISDHLVVLPDYHTAYIYLSKQDLDRFNYQIGDTEGIVNYALSIKNINLAALFIERDGIVKISFRSKGNFSVNKLAKDYFSGGGHRNAAGANCSTSLADTILIFKNLLPSIQTQLESVY